MGHYLRSLRHATSDDLRQIQAQVAEQKIIYLSAAIRRRRAQRRYWMAMGQMPIILTGAAAPPGIAWGMLA